MPPNSVSVSSLAQARFTTPKVQQAKLRSENAEPSRMTGVLFESDATTNDGALSADTEKYVQVQDRKIELVWSNVFLFSYVHLASMYGAYLVFAQAKWATIIFAAALYIMGLIGVTGGAHRLWSHRSFKAKWPLRVILVAFNTIAHQDAAFHWARDHRVHHKYSETDADPHNASRGIFYSHIGWLLCKKHPNVMTKGKNLDLSDLRADSVLMFQLKHYKILMPLACFILPTVIPMYFWNESLMCSWHVAAILRWCLTLNVVWLINSAAHRIGGRAYDKNINPSNSSYVSLVTLGEGSHNYHHVFPWDYKTSEWGTASLNMTTAFIDMFAKIGWAYDLKSVAPDIIERRVRRTGDGSHELWGWGDKDLNSEDVQNVLFVGKKAE